MPTTTGAIETRSGFSGLTPLSRKKAAEFFTARERRFPHHAWMADTFARIALAAQEGRLISKLAADSVRIPGSDDRTYFDPNDLLLTGVDRFKAIGQAAIAHHELLAIDLAAGMATGFGGGTKAVVRAFIKTDGAEEDGISYLAYKRAHYLRLQRKCQAHILAGLLVSDETEADVKKELKSFADKNDLHLVLIEEGAMRPEIERLWQKHKDSWEDTIIVPIFKQPSNLLISKDGREVGDEYIKGHGDIFEVIKAQARDLIEVVGVKHIFASNIDNIGALVSVTILGYFVEQKQQAQIQAILEAAQKYEGDKGGAPALINGVYSVLEDPFVPPEMREAFISPTVFPYFNTNSLWFDAPRVLSGAFDLPLMVGKEIPRDGKTWLKIETIMSHGLNFLKWKALVINRALRFYPAKFLTDVWIGRTDWMRWYNSRAIPAMRDGQYVPKPLLAVSNNILGGIAHLDHNIFAHGSHDSMIDAQTIAMGGANDSFDKLGALTTYCGVRYVGDVAIIFGHERGQSTGSLVIRGGTEHDEITLEDCVLFVPPATTVTVGKSVRGQRNPAVDSTMLRKFYNNAERWTDGQRARVINKLSK